MALNTEPPPHSRRRPLSAVCLGAGPAGLYFAISLKLRDPAHEITVIERNRADDTFGWGVVLSDETLDNLAANDAPSAAAIREHFAYWDDIAVHYRGTPHRLDRSRLLRHRPQAPAELLQARARELGVELVFETEVDDARLRSRVRSRRRRGRLNSRTRETYARTFARARLGAVQVRLARHRTEVRRRVHLHLRAHRARLDLGARVSVR